MANVSKHTPPFGCGECSKSFSSQKKLTQHQKNHRECPICWKHFRSEYHYSNHMKTHGNDAPRASPCYTCDVQGCGQSFNLPSSYELHISLHREKPYNCTECNAEYKKIFYFTKHMAEKHGQSVIKENKAYSPPKTLEKTLPKKGQQFYCKNCGKPYKMFHFLLKHQQAMKCSTRKMSLSSLSYKSHLRSSSNNDPSVLSGDSISQPVSFKTKEKHKCELCEKEYVKIGNLKNHYARVHYDEVSCKICSDVFPSVSAYSTHLLNQCEDQRKVKKRTKWDITEYLETEEFSLYFSNGASEKIALPYAILEDDILPESNDNSSASMAVDTTNEGFDNCTDGNESVDLPVPVNSEILSDDVYSRPSSPDSYKGPSVSFNTLENEYQLDLNDLELWKVLDQFVTNDVTDSECTILNGDGSNAIINDVFLNDAILKGPFSNDEATNVDLSDFVKDNNDIPPDEKEENILKTCELSPDLWNYNIAKKSELGNIESEDWVNTTAKSSNKFIEESNSCHDFDFIKNKETESIQEVIALPEIATNFMDSRACTNSPANIDRCGAIDDNISFDTDNSILKLFAEYYYMNYFNYITSEEFKTARLMTEVGNSSKTAYFDQDDVDWNNHDFIDLSKYVDNIDKNIDNSDSSRLVDPFDIHQEKYEMDWCFDYPLKETLEQFNNFGDKLEVKDENCLDIDENKMFICKKDVPHTFVIRKFVKFKLIDEITANIIKNELPESEKYSKRVLMVSLQEAAAKNKLILKDDDIQTLDNNLKIKELYQNLVISKTQMINKTTCHINTTDINKNALDEYNAETFNIYIKSHTNLGVSNNESSKDNTNRKTDSGNDDDTIHDITYSESSKEITDDQLIVNYDDDIIHGITYCESSKDITDGELIVNYDDDIIHGIAYCESSKDITDGELIVNNGDDITYSESFNDFSDGKLVVNYDDDTNHDITYGESSKDNTDGELIVNYDDDTNHDITYCESSKDNTDGELIANYDDDKNHDITYSESSNDFSDGKLVVNYDDDTNHDITYCESSKDNTDGELIVNYDDDIIHDITYCKSSKDNTDGSIIVNFADDRNHDITYSESSKDITDGELIANNGDDTNHDITYGESSKDITDGELIVNYDDDIIHGIAYCESSKDITDGELIVNNGDDITYSESFNDFSDGKLVVNYDDDTNHDITYGESSKDNTDGELIVNYDDDTNHDITYCESSKDNTDGELIANYDDDIIHDITYCKSSKDNTDGSIIVNFADDRNHDITYSESSKDITDGELIANNGDDTNHDITYGESSKDISDGELIVNYDDDIIHGIAYCESSKDITDGELIANNGDDTNHDITYGESSKDISDGELIVNYDDDKNHDITYSESSNDNAEGSIIVNFADDKNHDITYCESSKDNSDGSIILNYNDDTNHDIIYSESSKDSIDDSLIVNIGDDTNQDITYCKSSNDFSDGKLVAKYDDDSHHDITYCESSKDNSDGSIILNYNDDTNHDIIYSESSKDSIDDSLIVNIGDDTNQDITYCKSSNDFSDGKLVAKYDDDTNHDIIYSESSKDITDVVIIINSEYNTGSALIIDHDKILGFKKKMDLIDSVAMEQAAMKRKVAKKTGIIERFLANQITESSNNPQVSISKQTKKGGNGTLHYVTESNKNNCMATEKNDLAEYPESEEIDDLDNWVLLHVIEEDKPKSKIKNKFTWDAAKPDYSIDRSLHGPPSSQNSKKKLDTTCRFCDQKFKTVHFLQSHVRDHLGQRFECPTCLKSFSSRSSLLRHGDIHLNIRRHHCHYCGQLFRYKHSLIAHRKSQHEVKNFSCVYCHKLFVTLEGYERHLNTHGSKKKFTCPECDVRFNLETSLECHMYNHDKEKPVVCFMCSRKFINSFRLKLHVAQQHSRQPTFSCTVCFMSFNSVKMLEIHEKGHSADKEYLCRCGDSFIFSSQLRRHQTKCYFFK